MENNQNNSDESTSSNANRNIIDEVKNFYKGDFKQIFGVLFKQPIDGTLNIFKNPGEKSYSQSLIMYASVYVLYVVGLYILSGEAREYIKFEKFIKAGLAPIIFMLILSVISCVIKSKTGKPQFKLELLTGALCGIPLAMIMPILLIIKMTVDTDDLTRLAENFGDISVAGFLLIFYILIMLINILQQSLRSAGIKDNIVFYLSPASIFLAGYLSFKIIKGLF